MTADNERPRCEGTTNKGRRCRMTATSQRWWLGDCYRVCEHHTSGLFRPAVTKEREE